MTLETKVDSKELLDLHQENERLRLRNAELVSEVRACEEDIERFNCYALLSAERYWETDENHLITEMSAPTTVLTIPTEELIGKFHWTDKHIYKNPAELTNIKAVFAAQKPFKDLKLSYVRKDGVTRHLLLHGQPNFNNEGVFLGFSGISINATEKFEAESYAKRAERVLNEASIGICVWDTDERLIMFNHFFENMVDGIKGGLVPGITLVEYLRQISENILSETSDADQWVEERVAEHRSASSDREMRCGNRWYQHRKIRLRDGSVLVLNTDITDKKVAEKAREQADSANQKFIDAMEHLNDGYVLWDADERLVVCNAEFRRKHSEIGEILKPGITFEEFTTAASELRWQEITENYSSKEEWIQSRLMAYRSGNSSEVRYRDGQWVQITKQHLKDGGVMALHTDVTELKEALNAAEDSSRTKSEFLANMSHELRTPLNAIIGFSEILGQGILGPLSNDNQQEYMDNILNSGRHLLGLVDEILDVSVIESGNVVLDEKVIDVGEIATDAMHLVRVRAQQKSIELEFQFENKRFTVLGDERRLKQVFLNLLTNAVKFTNPGGHIQLKVWLNDDGAMVFSCSDTGIGMDEAGIKLAMEKFGKIDNEVGLQNEGTGLGLPLTIGLVEAHGGSLKITSEINKGTTVTVVLPRERVLV